MNQVVLLLRCRVNLTISGPIPFDLCFTGFNRLLEGSQGGKKHKKSVFHMAD